MSLTVPYRENITPQNLFLRGTANCGQEFNKKFGAADWVRISENKINFERFN
jgi:hypothetical protein